MANPPKPVFSAGEQRSSLLLQINLRVWGGLLPQSHPLAAHGSLGSVPAGAGDADLALLRDCGNILLPGEAAMFPPAPAPPLPLSPGRLLTGPRALRSRRSR